MKAPTKKTKKVPHPTLLRELIDAAMELERRTMKLYCRFESTFAKPEEVRSFWFDMAQHESRHYGALALVGGLLEGTPDRNLPAAVSLTPDRIDHLRRLLDGLDHEARAGINLARAFEMAVEIESSEIEDLVLDLLSALKGEAEREKAVQLLIHDLSDLTYMIEKYTTSHALLARADALVESQVGRLRSKAAAKRPGLRRIKG